MRRWLSRTAVLLPLLGAAGTIFGGDYLSTVGPPPLRFEAPLGPATALFYLPPLDPPATNTPPVPAANTNQPLTLTEPLTMASNSPPILPVMEPAVVTSAAPSWPTNVVQLVIPDAPPLSPQMFLQYFSRGAGSNGPGSSVLIPMNFLPPVPLVPPSSSAIYEVTPAPKPQ